MDKSEFLTPDFLFEEGRVYLFRKRRAYRNFDYSAIESIEFRKGSDLPRPLLAIVTGVALFLYVIVQSIIIDLNFYGALESGVFFILIISGYLFYTGAPVHRIVAIKAEGKTEKYRIAVLEKSKQLDALINFLQTKIGSDKVIDTLDRR